MVGQSSKFIEEDVNMNNYHGRRRNAASNINRPHFDHAPQSSGSNRISRVTTNPIHARLGTRGPHQKDFRWKNTSDVTGHDDRATTSDPEQRNYSNRFRFNKKNVEVASTMRSIGRLKITKPTERKLKIGDSIDESSSVTVKPILPTQSFCKLASMEQGVFDLIVKFVQLYFTCFDKNRDELLSAYHAKALFSISFNLRSSAISKRQGTIRFGSYINESRNLIYVQDKVKAFEMLHRNNIDIVAYLKKLPEIEHVPDSLKLDTCFFQPNMLTFSVSGVYKEKKRESTEISACYRAFQRTFVCVPVSNEQMIIVNEQCILSNLSEQQTKLYKTEESTVVEGPMNTDPGEEKNNMIKKFSEMTNLSLNWSKDCLEFSDWNYEVAFKNFVEHRNDIPAEAFIQGSIMM